MAATATFTFPPPYLWPIGFGFRPTEEELINHYLKNKILGHESLVKYIHEIDLYKYDPWELPAQSFFESDNFEWFFFRAHTSETKRSTPTGGWKPTGDDRPIMARGTNRLIATRKILVFYRGQGKNAVKTNWVIHEYRLHPDTRQFVICRLKENAEKRDVSICDQDEHNSTVASRLKNKGTRRAIQELEMNRDAQANGQSVLHPLRNSRQPSLADLQSVDAYDDDGEVNMQPIQPGASENEDNLTEVLNSILLPDEYVDDATSKMCRSPWQPEPALMDFQPSNGNDGEVSNRLLQAEAFESENLYEHLLKSVLGEDENCDEVISNNLIDSYNKEELDSMVLELQSGFSSDTDTNTTFGLPNNHFSSSCFHEYGGSAVQNMSTIKKSRRSPLTVKRKYELQGSSSVLSGEGEARTCGISMESNNSDPGPRTSKAQRQPKSSAVVPYGSEPKRDQLKREIRSKAMSQFKAKEDERHIEIVDSSPQLSMTDSNNGLKSEVGNKATKSGMSCCGSIGSTKNRFSYILTTKRIHHNSSLPLFYVAKAFLGIVMFVMFAQELILYGHRR